MTQRKSEDKILEFNTLFLSLDEKNQDAAVIILKALAFAQSVNRTPALQEAGKQQKGDRFMA